MKKLLLFLLISGFALGQSLDRFYGLDSLQMKQVSDEIALATGKNFVFQGFNEGGKNTTAIYKEAGDTNDDVALNVSFGFYQDGENKALEIKGVKRWSLRAVSGKFLAVAPVWKNYFDPNVDFVKMSKKNQISLPYGKFSYMNKNPDYDNFWTIYFKD